MNILVVRFSSMGDVICATPLFSFLKKKHPAASITFVTDKAYAGFFVDDPRLSRVVEVDKGVIDSALTLLAGPWDLVVDLQNNARSRRLLARIGCRGGTGIFNKLHAQRLILLVFRCSLYDRQQNVVTRYIRAAGGPVSMSDLDEGPRLFFCEESRMKAREVMLRKTDGTKRPLIALFPFSAWKNKEWPRENYVKTGGWFLSKGWEVVIMGGGEDADPAMGMRDQIGGRCISLAGSLSLHECGALLTSFSLALGNDTGLSHLARASGVKTGVIFGPTTWHFGFYPYGKPGFRIFEEPLACRPCHAHGGDVCLRTSHACMKRISADRVIKGLEELQVAGLESAGELSRLFA